MKDFVFITGNQHKADYLAKWLGRPIRHRKIDADEIQSLDFKEVVEHKVRQAYAIAKEPVLVEDVGVSFVALGRLPGPLTRWFLEEIGNEGLCKLADGLEHRGARAEILYGYFDGKEIHYFGNSIDGMVAPEPRGNHGFGWNPVFIPEGSTKTYAEMPDEEVRPFSIRARAIDKLRAFLDKD